MKREPGGEPAHARGARRLLIGSSSGGEDGQGEAGKGVYVSYFHAGVLGTPKAVAEADKPSYLAVDHSGSVLYAVLGGDENPSVAARFSLNRSHTFAERTVREVGAASSNGVGGAFISTTPDGRNVFVANYVGGSVASFIAGKHGELRIASYFEFSPDAHGPMPDRQEGSHPHSIRPSPEGRFVFVNDLGLDRVHIFRLDHATATLSWNDPDHWAAEPGSGPRHLVYHPNGRWVYCINELNSTIDQLAWDAARGVLSTQSTVNTLPEGTSREGKRACEMVFSKDARFVYASNRGYEGFTVFAVHEDTGGLTSIQHVRNPGKESRDLALDPTGRWLLSANQFSDEVSVFPVDAASGKMSARVDSVKVPGPSCLLFA